MLLINTDNSGIPNQFGYDNHKAMPLVRFWLYSVAFLILVMILVGGATRLTDSGLSITEWRPLLGALPPLDHASWLEAFDKYKLIPEYQQINSGMTLDEFKNIYWWEWGHRFLGRFIGLFFLIPMLWFWFRGALDKTIKPKLVVLFILGGIQGAIGWWMVTSGLVDRVDVSQYRLATHLVFACVIFTAIVWVARGYRTSDKIPKIFSAEMYFPHVCGILILVLVQIFLGGLVAGLDAGLSYNTWPLMDGDVLPSGLLDLSPAWINVFENELTVQFNHRIVAYLLAVWVVIYAISVLRDEYADKADMYAWAMLGAVTLQVGLGISTLILVVPFHLALLHQAGAVLLLFLAALHLRDLKDASRIS